MKISVVIALYKGNDCLHELYRRLTDTLERMKVEFELLFVEDAGGDQSWDRLHEMARHDPRVKGLQFSRNFGQHYGIAAGLDHCDGDWVVVMDCDLQDRPEDIPRLLARALDGFDVVLTKRVHRTESAFRQFQALVFADIFRRLTDRSYDFRIGAFRLISRRVVMAYRHFKEKTRLLGGAIDWLGFPTTTIEVVQDDRFAGQSSYTTSKLVRLALDGIIAYSDKPLRLSIRWGLITAAFAFFAGVTILLYALFGGHPVPGWASVMVSLYFVGGLLFANLGLMGSYIGKIFEETKDRPPYVVADAIGAFPDPRHQYLRPRPTGSQQETCEA